METRRGPWYLLTGLILGAAAGLIYAWLISPVRYVETAPSSLRSDFKENYRSMIAAAYAADGDIGRAASRLALLGDADPAQTLAGQAQQVIARGGLQSDAEPLAQLAAALARQPSAVIPPTATPTAITTATTLYTPTVLSGERTATRQVTSILTPTPALTIVVYENSPSPTLPPPSPTFLITPTKHTGTALPTLTPSSTPGSPFALEERSRVCDQTKDQPMLQVQLNDASGNPVAGVEIHVSWQDGEDTFFTGLMPDINPGFADFQMTPGITYTLHLADGGQPVSDLFAVACTASGGTTYWGGWYLVLQQP